MPLGVWWLAALDCKNADSEKSNLVTEVVNSDVSGGPKVARAIAKQGNRIVSCAPVTSRTLTEQAESSC